MVFTILSFFVIQLKERIVGAYEAARKGVFITATSLIILIAVRNSLMWFVLIVITIVVGYYTHNI